MLTNDILAQWDRDHFVHPATHLSQHARGETPNPIIVTGSNSHIQDRNGNKMLDAFAGLYCVNVGYGRKEIADAIADQAHKLAFFHSFAGHGSEPAITLAKMVADRAPQGVNKVFFSLGGSDANETNIKFVWYYHHILGQPQKRKIISRQRAYHGSGIVTASMTGLPLYHKHFGLPVDFIHHAAAPYYYRRHDRNMSQTEFSRYCAEDLEKLILREDPDTIAAFIAEPVLGTGGIVPPPEGYWEAIKPILAKYDILFIVDEVVTGFGRLGTMFGCQYYDLKPDLMTVAKGLSSAYAPISASLISDRVWSVLEQGGDRYGVFGHAWTYSAHPLSAAASIANLELIDKLDLIANAADVGAYLNDCLATALADHPLVGEIRGVGMLAAIELVANRDGPIFFDPPGAFAAKVIAAMRRRNVIARAMPHGDILGFAPPLCLTRDEADIIVKATVESLSEVVALQSAS